MGQRFEVAAPVDEEVSEVVADLERLVAAPGADMNVRTACIAVIAGPCDRLTGGDKSAADQLLQHVYDELRGLADRYFEGRRGLSKDVLSNLEEILNRSDRRIREKNWRARMAQAQHLYWADQKGSRPFT